MLSENLADGGIEVVSTKPTCPSWSLPRASRATAKKLHLSKRHQQDLLGTQSPGPATYTPQRQRKSPSCSFGRSNRPCSAPVRRASTSDLLANVSAPEKADLKPRPGSAVIGRASRNVVPVQPDVHTFLFTDSPGPMRYNPGRDIVERSAPSYSIRPRGFERATTTSKVGPGLYPVQTREHMRCASTLRCSPQWSIARQERWRRTNPRRSARNCSSDRTSSTRCLLRGKAGPGCTFGRAGRDEQRKLGVFQCAAERQPHRLRCPDLPPHLDVTLRPFHEEVTKMPGGHH
ncbi:hypothetical protein AK812_SmicGene1254 [Symbiodinium microadriaticum]|uniref:Uncharacterized protein n=1 Tax=Symbiodinium microadriaticum TaxID=2951 RepID=A0A1Q9F4P0_SYMMI|nr:hypothetical protein AK812_SmicGene1254 [Symbiodinium microadriaticum]